MDNRMIITWKEFCDMVTATGVMSVANAVFRARVADDGESVILEDFDNLSNHPDVLYWDYKAGNLVIPRDLNLGAGDYGTPWAGEVQACAGGSFTVEVPEGTLEVFLLTCATPALWQGYTRGVCGIVDEVAASYGLEWDTDSNIQVLVEIIEACVAPSAAERVVKRMAAAEAEEETGEEEQDG